jgi:outer membrane protein
MFKIILSTIFLLLASFLAVAQTKLSLKEAIKIGIENNFDVAQSQLETQKADINYKQSRAHLLPDLNASANHGTNQGRSIDPFTNSFINQNVNYANYGVSSSVLLFNGLALQKQIKTNKLGLEASKMELQQSKDNLTINIILSYLSVLSAEENLQQSIEQKTVSDSQVNRLMILNQTGAISPSEYYDLKGQLAADEINIVNNKAEVETAKLNLSQLLNIPYDKNLLVEKLPENSFTTIYENTSEEVYATALQQFAQIKSVELRKKTAIANIHAIKGQLFPTLSLDGNAYTNYSSVASQDFFVNSIEAPGPDYVIINGSKTPVITKQNQYTTKKITFGNQLNNNFFTTFNLSLSIPLFNASQVRNKIKLAKIELKNSELIEQNTRIELQQEIERAYVNLVSSTEKYKLLLDQVASFQESFNAAEIKFNSGAITSVDYLVAKNNLDKAKSNLISAKYDIILREKILDYYQGKENW